MSNQQFFVLVLIVVVVTAAILGFLQNRPKYGKVIIGEKELRVELADTAAKRQEGLSGRDNLKENTGMLFVFDVPGEYGIWMKDMKFPIDIIWTQNDKIIDIIPNVSPDDQETTYYPREEANFVLEMNAGFVEENDIELGGNVDIFF